MVVDLNGVPGFAADADRPLIGMELKAGAAVAALDDEQRRHGGLIRDGRRIGGGEASILSQQASRWKRASADPGGGVK